MKKITPVMACATAVFLSFSYTHQLMAQTRENATEAVSSAVPADIQALAGKIIDPEHINELVTTGRPWDETDKMYLFYNVGTKKFLNVGSYWGTHAVLSDVPRPFWLQRRNEKYVSGQTNVPMRFPESFADKGTFAYDFFTLPTFQIGAKQGNLLSYVKYNYVRLVNTSNNSYTNLLEENYQGTGTAISIADNQAIDFDNQRFEAEIDLTDVKETYDTSMGGSGDKIENILSLGNGIGKWASDGSVIDLHFYASKTSDGNYEVRVNSLSKDYQESTHKKTVNIGRNHIAKIVITKGSITVNGVECEPGVATRNYESPIKSLLSIHNLQVGSERDVKSKAIYNTIKKISYEKLSTPTVVDLTSKTTEKDGNKKWMATMDGNLSTNTIKAAIDLSTCGNEEENVLSVGTNIAIWGNNSNEEKAENIHLYYIKSTKTLKIDVAYTVDKNKRGQMQTTTVVEPGVLTVEISKDGLKLNGETFDIMSDSHSKQVVDFLTNTATSIQIGSQEKKVGTNATYSSLTWTENVSTQKVETPIYTNQTLDGNATYKDITLNLSDNESLEAEVNLANCDSKGENILSIGDNISVKGKDENAHNLHIYLRKTDWSDDNAYIEYVDKDYSNECKRAFTITRDNDGNAIMKLVLNKEGVFINGQEMFPSTDPQPTTPYIKNRAGDVVRYEQYEGDDNIFKLNEYGKYIIAEENEQNAESLTTNSNGYLYVEDNFKNKLGATPLFVSSRFIQSSGDSNNQGQFFGWAPKLSNSTWGTVGVFADRDIPQKDLSDTKKSFNASQWFFEPVSSSDNGHLYKIYLKMDDAEIPYRTGELGYDKFAYTTQSGKFYLQATSEQVYGNSLEDYGGGIHAATPTLGTEDYTDVEALNNEPTDANLGLWKLIDVNEYYELFRAAHTEMSQMLDLTFQLRDPSFSRLSSELSNWKMDNSLDGKIRIGYDNYSKKKLDDTDYTTDDGKATTAYAQKASNHARYSGVDVKGGTGKFYQTVTLYNAGWYAIRCGGISTVGASLFAQYNNEVVQQELHRLTKNEYSKLTQTKGLVWPYQNGMPMYNALVAMNDNQADDNAETTYKDFNNQLVFFLDPDVLKANGGKMDITFGIDIPSAGGNIDLLSENDDLETSVEWTVFDNFHLLFGGNDGEPFLILDEDDTTEDHLDETIHKYRSGTVDGKVINKKLLLHRTFSAGNWNTIMLPVGLTKEQFDQAFGENTPLAELDRLTDKEVQFKTVTQSSLYEDGKYDDIEYWMKPMTPYIIKTSKTNGGNTEEYTAHLYTWASNGTNYEEKTIGGSNKPYFLIDNINMVEGIVKNKTITDGTFGSHWDFKGMTHKIDGVEYPYVMQGQVANQNGTMTAYGHLAKNFTTTAGKNKLIAGRAPMADSYTMSKNQLTYLKSGGASKGFRCWFQYTRPSDVTAAKPMLVLDGVEMTTGIDNIMGNDDGITPIDKYNRGVYTLNGQLVRRGNSTDGLPKGIYIVDGRKVVKE